MKLGTNQWVSSRFATWWTILGVGAPVLLTVAQNPAVLTDLHPVDLSALCATAFSNSPSPQSWSALPRGLQAFDGVPFRIDGKLEVTGMDDARNGEFHPPAIANIPVGSKAGRLHLVHGAVHEERDGVPLAMLVLHYPDGQMRTIRLA